MNNKNSPPTSGGGGRICPVCGKSTYSRGGIHPQCAIAKADEPRQKELAEQRKKEAAEPKPKSDRFTKHCPKCGAKVHVRLKKCECGKALL